MLPAATGGGARVVAGRGAARRRLEHGRGAALRAGLAGDEHRTVGVQTQRLQEAER